MYPTLKEYVQKDLERRFYSATGAEFIDVIEQALYYHFTSLAKQMLADLGDDEARLWRMHRRTQQHDEHGEQMMEESRLEELE